ncbi:MAG TPA: hypothetical protein VNN25_08260 [Thermoanaerobaculia bacterium]|nr:hypothetical protein [Thermoanaerobaculia bacterium]
MAKKEAVRVTKLTLQKKETANVKAGMTVRGNICCTCSMSGVGKSGKQFGTTTSAA